MIMVLFINSSSILQITRLAMQACGNCRRRCSTITHCCRLILFVCVSFKKSYLSIRMHAYIHTGIFKRIQYRNTHVHLRTHKYRQNDLAFNFLFFLSMFRQLYR